MKRAARIIRRGSSVKETSGDSGVRSLLRGEVGHAVERVDEDQVGKGEGHRVDCEVASGQVGLQGRGEDHVGFARAAVVLLGPVSRYLDAPTSPLAAPIVPKRLPCVQMASAQGARTASVWSRQGVGGEVEVAVAG